METNWNQLIERYLQNELSEEGRNAFEQELEINPELKEELELHRLIQSAAKRASQRNMIQQTGKLYMRNLRIKQFSIGIAVAVATTIGVLYWANHAKEHESGADYDELKEQNQTEQQTADAAPADTTGETYFGNDTLLSDQPNQPGGKSSLIQPTDWHTAGESDSRMNAYLNTLKGSSDKRTEDKAFSNSLKTEWVSAKPDSLQFPEPTELVLGYSTDKLNLDTIESSIPSGTVGRDMLWMQKYDSVGKFNELYCGYALVMDEAKFGFVDPDGKIFIPLIYDQIVVTTNIKSSKQKNKRSKKKVLYIPKRSGKDVKDCEEGVIKMEMNNIPASEPIPIK